ncbi:MAG TPA: hypothetical protein VJ583_08720, partial [Nitrososphaeraceae archaeon]|nr:hypothetical protein [Nitrososphaeraceae archaeon]
LADNCIKQDQWIKTLEYANNYYAASCQYYAASYQETVKLTKELQQKINQLKEQLKTWNS